MDRRAKTKNHTFVKIIQNDLRYGIVRSWKYYIPLLIVMLFFFAFFRNSAVLTQQIHHFTEKITFQNYIIEFLKGMPEFHAYDVNARFEVPAGWLFFYLWNACLIAMYPERERKTNRRYLILQCQSRKLWWLGKCIWCMAGNLVSVLTMLLSAAPFAFMQSDGSGGIAAVTFQYLDGVNFTGIDKTWVGCFAFQAFLVLCGLSILQAAVTLYTRPIAGFLFIACILIISAYYLSPYLPGNYLMLLRMKEFSENGGVTIAGGIMAGSMMCVLGAGIGCFKVRKMDIL